ncbi:penicillin-binding protein 2, partial [Myxococcota bacterium]|nr:penicillin-binding protein 2 [Myxococcota bacterium]
MREEEYRVFRGRVRFVAFVILLGLVGVFARVAHLQISRYEELSALSEQEYLRDLKVAPHRGEILDRHNKPLALTVKTPSVIANPSKIQDPRQAARKLAALLNTDLDTIYRRLASERRFAWLERHITPDVAEKVRALNIEGVSLTTEPRRFYPNRHLAAHVVGFAGTDSQGLAGIERSMDKALEGEAQVIEAIRDGRGRAVLDGTMDPSGRARGKDIRLTIDSQIQHVAESALRRIRRETKAVAAVAIVLDVKSADLLAVAVDPHFNPNKPGLSTADERRNRAITDIFEPGSTMKPLALAAALEAGAVKINDKIFCENGKFQIGGYTIRDTHKLGLLNLSDIISRSSNIGSAKIGKALGKERMAAALRAFGFGQKSDLSFPGESRGLLRDPSKWSNVGLANISFGHGIAVTLLQLASAYRVMAADGIYMPPRLVSHIGGEEQRKNRKSRRVISKSVVQQVLPMMEAVVAEGGTGPRARVPGYRVAGKTGTAQ